MLSCLEVGLEEDCPYGDITSELVVIEGKGKFQFISRTPAIISGTLGLKSFFESKQLQVNSCRNPREQIESGDIIIEAQGDLAMLFKLWRISQTYLTVLCAIATQTHKVVQVAKEANPQIEVIVAARKAHLGMRKEEIQAVLDGGAIYHRNSLSDTILITQNHLRLGNNLEEIYSFHHKIEVEPRSEEEAYQWAKKADIIILDHFSPSELARIRRKLKELNPTLKVGVAGGVKLENIKEYAQAVDIVLLSSVLYAPPLDFTCKIDKDIDKDNLPNL